MKRKVKDAKDIHPKCFLGKVIEIKSNDDTMKKRSPKSGISSSQAVEWVAATPYTAVGGRTDGKKMGEQR